MMNTSGNRIARLIGLLVLVCAMVLASPGHARTLLKNICRVKGQEENTLHGLGLVTGLKGTGDGSDFLPTIRSLATALQLMGTNSSSKADSIDIKDAKNVALVMVTATVPAAGARQGDVLDCMCSSIGTARSLAGGTLFMTPLQGPLVPPAVRPTTSQNITPRGSTSRVYAFAQGLLHTENTPTWLRFTRVAGWRKTFSTCFPRKTKSRWCSTKTMLTFRSPRTSPN